MLLTLLHWRTAGAAKVVVTPPFTGERENYTGRYLITANRAQPYLHGSVWKKTWRDQY